MVPLKSAPIAIGCLLLASSSLARTSDFPATSVPSDVSFVNADAAMAEAMQRTLPRAMIAAFPSPRFFSDNESADNDAAFFPQQVLTNTQQPSPAPPNPGPPNLNDLGFPAGQTQGNPQEQARLDKRSHMLKIHQRLGLITTIPLIATVVTGTMAGGRNTSSTTRDLHAALGSTTAGLYFTTAYFSIFAPKVPSTHTRGPIRLHKALAWIHGPGMILTPFLGAMAFEQKSQGERLHGIASAHGAVAIVTAGAYGLAIAAVSLHF